MLTALNVSGALLLFVLSVLSVSVGVAGWDWAQLFYDSDAALIFMVSRLPRTLAIILAGATLSIAAMIMQVLLRNRFIEPSMIGATQSATFGLLLMVIFFPAASILIKVSVAAVCSLVGMAFFVLLLQSLPKTQILLVPVVGIIYGGIIDAATTFIGFETETMQLLAVWTSGDFSHILLGRYELLWLTLVLAVCAYILADRLTIAGLGKNIAINLGLNHRKVVWLGLIIVAMITAVVVLTVGSIPFIGLVVPNIVSRLAGDRLRKNLPAVALLGACMVLACDIIGRLINFPYEIPVSTIFGVLGTLMFLYLLYYQPKVTKTSIQKCK